ncbi:integrating conjugative element protein, PFL_4695 family (plasmid) [Legionella adelaidensis]|uniref:Integrating conjugative element protein, PFL_4695 family n=1 Tax=Legionella adelaidensis TaxID=45056 RepID=A0A0W0R5K1_9GAMM|nr:integrating conjugative element protein [Legionella adelaidensis]KTC66355.1 hypothetical protein Lade_1013 [Legionella adelaidensis]VEH84953.1 integrating conjugative element protein, PFL_4695 family [Legionella adelaidensis]
MAKLLLLLLITFNAHAMDVIPLTVTHDNAAMRLNLSSPIGVPVKSKATVGKVIRNKLKTDLINIAIFVIGVDDTSLKWLATNQERLQAMQAIGFVTNVNDLEKIIALQEKYQLPLLPVNVDPLLSYIQVQHYPLIIAGGAVWQ